MVQRLRVRDHFSAPFHCLQKEADGVGIFHARAKKIKKQ